jgi:penicillin-binding protein 1A
MNGWRPQNTHEDEYDLKFSMEEALAKSINTVSVKVLDRAGIPNTISIAKKMGINSYLPPYLSLALGAADISMIEMVTAYACFVNNGMSVKPFYIKTITTHDGIVLENFNTKQPAQQVLLPDNAKLIVQMLKRTVNDGTGIALRSTYGIQNDIAGKTGTTQSNADGWFIAMSPKIVIGAWVGSDDRRIRFRTTALGQGATTALPIIGKMFQHINADRELRQISSAQFPTLPPSLAERLTCDPVKSDMNFLEKLFGRRDKDKKRGFDDNRRKGFFRKLFGRG